MALGGEVHDHVGREAAKELAHSRRVDDVGLDEGEARVSRNRLEIVEVAGVGQLVDDEHLVWRCADQLAHHG